jgi:hypothetical protein
LSTVSGFLFLLTIIPNLFVSPALAQESESTLKHNTITRESKLTGCELSFTARYTDWAYCDAGASARSMLVGNIRFVFDGIKMPHLQFKAIGFDFLDADTVRPFHLNFVILKAGDAVLNSKTIEFDCDGGKCSGYLLYDNNGLSNKHLLERIEQGQFEIVYNRVVEGLDVSVPIADLSKPLHVTALEKWQICNNDCG